ncbi:MAG: hypothetical protein IPJ76_02950 [Flavobacteriales bacterium]|nr:MAG: hypothetical protein IPJ76_02950 [Flavobacteriales bacterium]
MRRLFYVPGLLSLVVLAPSLMWFLNSKEVWVEERCIQMTFPTEAATKEDSAQMPGRWNLPERNWIELHFSGGLGESRAMLDEFDRHARDLVRKQDTVNGLHVTLARNIKWETVIAAVDILEYDSIRAWMVDEQDITAFYLQAAAISDPAEAFGVIEHDLSFCGYDYDPPPSFYDRILDRAFGPFLALKESPMVLWPIAIALLALLLSTAWWLVGRTRNNLP